MDKEVVKAGNSQVPTTSEQVTQLVLRKILNKCNLNTYGTCKCKHD